VFLIYCLLSFLLFGLSTAYFAVNSLFLYWGIWGWLCRDQLQLAGLLFGWPLGGPEPLHLMVRLQPTPLPGGQGDIPDKGVDAPFYVLFSAGNFPILRLILSDPV
jgi:hypothetical protein